MFAGTTVWVWNRRFARVRSLLISPTRRACNAVTVTDPFPYGVIGAFFVSFSEIEEK
jgi:hypothetical protein